MVDCRGGRPVLLGPVFPTRVGMLRFEFHHTIFSGAWRLTVGSRGAAPELPLPGAFYSGLCLAVKQFARAASAADGTNADA